MDKTIFNGHLGFWDYVTIAFYTRFAPKKLSALGPAKATLFALPNGKTFFSASPRLQELRSLPTSAPLPMPQGSVVPYGVPDVFASGVCTSASPELDDEFEASIQKRNADELEVLRTEMRRMEGLTPRFAVEPSTAIDLTTLTNTTDGKKE